MGPRPSCPCKPRPHVYTHPPDISGGTCTNAEECHGPAAICKTASPRNASISAGLVRVLVSPRPRRPPSPHPHAYTPLTVTASVWAAPHATLFTKILLDAKNPTTVGTVTPNGTSGAVVPARRPGSIMTTAGPNDCSSPRPRRPSPGNPHANSSPSSHSAMECRCPVATWMTRFSAGKSRMRAGMSSNRVTAPWPSMPPSGEPHEYMSPP